MFAKDYDLTKKEIIYIIKSSVGVKWLYYILQT